MVRRNGSARARLGESGAARHGERSGRDVGNLGPRQYARPLRATAHARLINESPRHYRAHQSGRRRNKGGIPTVLERRPHPRKQQPDQGARPPL